MATNEARSRGRKIELPSSAPIVRLTAGLGSQTQKTWNLRRPVTVIGSQRPAGIVLHDRDVCKAHCVIVNTGSVVLLKDLHTPGGTLRNKDPVRLSLLEDGDVITVGEIRIQIAIRLPHDEKEDSAYGKTYNDPTRLHAPLILRLERGNQEWTVEDAVALLGRLEEADVRLDHDSISVRHAIVFRFEDEAAVFDLGGRGGMSVNGESCAMCGLANGDRLTLGSLGLQVQTESRSADSRPLVTESLMPASRANEESSPSPVLESPRSGDQKKPAENAPVRSFVPTLNPAAPTTATGKAGPSRNTNDPLEQLEAELAALQKGISESWDRMNAWETQLAAGAADVDAQQSTLAAKEAELETRDAALRGQLHDLTRLHEQLITRERELAAKQAAIDRVCLRTADSQAELAAKEADLNRRTEEIQRRELALAQRWTRLQTATCTNCGSPLRDATYK